MQKTQEMQVWYLDQEDPLKKGMQPTSIFLPGKPQRLKSWMGDAVYGFTELDMTEHTQT